MSKLILEEETHRILGACFEVYKEKGCGFVEQAFSVCSVHSVVVAHLR